MKKEKGFTLIELWVTLAIVGVLLATAVPLYHTWQQRAYGSEAAIMIKQILDAQILYFLEHDKFFPIDETPINILHNTSPNDPDIDLVYQNLNILIPTGHFIEYHFQTVNASGNESFFLTVNSKDNAFDIFKGTKIITGFLDKDGKIDFVTSY